jgi:hypothetical protein
MSSSSSSGRAAEALYALGAQRRGWLKETREQTNEGTNNA